MLNLGALIGEVERQAGAVAAPVERGAEHDRTAIFVVDGDVAPATGAVDADAHRAVGAHSAPEIEGAADMGVRQIVDGDAVRILVPGALGLQVDGAAERGAAGRGTEREGASAVQYLAMVIEFGREELPRRTPDATLPRESHAYPLEKTHTA